VDKMRMTAVALMTGMLGWASSARADLISVGFSTTSAPPVTAAASSSTGDLSYSTGVGPFSVNQITAIGTPGVPEPILDTTSIDVSSGGSGTLYVWITEQYISSPAGVSNFMSGFTSNTWNGLVTSVVETTYLSDSNALFGGTELATTTFTAQSQSLNETVASPNLTSPYSETVEYILTFGGGGSANDTINMAAVPEPASLALLGVGIFGVGISKRRRRARL
jgi:PEP-CTERM motif